MPRLPVFRIHPLLAVSLLLAALVALPVGSVLFNVVQGGSEGTGAVWAHLASTVLPDYLASTFWLCLGVAIGTIVVGVTTAWLNCTVSWLTPSRLPRNCTTAALSAVLIAASSSRPCTAT